MDENKIFLKTVEEKYERFLDYYTMMSSDFLSLEQQSALAGFLRAHSKENVYLFGGYPEAERRQVLFLPDYTGLAPQAQDADLLEYFRENPDDCPIALLDVRVASAAREKLTHRDYLGALMGEGIRREKVGDIIVTERGAQILAMKEMCAYLAQNFRQCDFATAIMQGAGLACKVEPVTSEQYAAMNPASANRPAWSALDNRMLRCTVGDEMRDWQDALKDYFANWNGEL